jgi:hypothetical protein
VNRLAFSVLHLLIAAIFNFLVVGCSTLDFSASGKTPFKISAQPHNEIETVVEGSVDFYFWGRSPGSRKVDLEEIERSHGLINPGYVSVEQFTGFKSVLYTIVSLGLYCPVDYRIVLLSNKGPHLK